MKSNKFGIATLVLIGLFLGFSIYALSRGGGASATDSPEGTGSFADLLNNPAPKFDLRDRDGNQYTNENLKGKKVVLFFNEGIMCYPACWNQIVALGADPRFKADDVVALSVVVDSKEQWDSAIAKMPDLAKARLGIDFSRATSLRYGALTTPSSMHYGSLPGHTYVVIDREGIVRYTLDDPRMSINNDLIWSEVQKIK